MNQEVKERDYKIDILRFIAIICIILSHTKPPETIFLLRNFDVTLMVMIMGASFYLSNNNKNINYSNYIIKRFYRLIVSTWIFLFIFFIAFYIISLLTNTEYRFGLKSILESYLLIERTGYKGIGYVWIMRVFFLIAILNPIILYISNKIKYNRNYFIGLILIYILYLGLISINSKLSGVIKLIFENIIISLIGWGLIGSIGIRLKKMSKKELYIYGSISLIIFICLAYHYNFDSTQNYKYPPTIYYISYGVFVSLFLLIILDFECIYNIFNNRCVKYISTNSLWLYFWHIIPIYILKIYGSSIPLINSNFITRFIFIFTFAMIITIIQGYAKTKIRHKKRCK